MKLKKLIVLIILACPSATIFAQTGGTNPTRQHYLNLYQRGVKYNDSRTAITALHGYLSFGDDITYKDTLGLIYYLAEDYYSSLLITKEVTDLMPDNLGALERLASCYNQLGDLKACVESYEKLCPKTKNPYHYYQLAVAQYQLKRIAECSQNLQLVIADTISYKTPVSFTNNDGKAQNVSLLAASYNMLGVIQMDAKNYSEARKFFNKSLESFPEFIGAKENLQLLDKNVKGIKQTTKQPTIPKKN